MEKIVNCKEFCEYFSILQQLDDCIVFISVKDNIGKYFSDKHQDILNNLGLTMNLINKAMSAYIAVINDHKIIYEKLSEINGCEEYHNILNGKKIDIISKPYKSGNMGTISINNVDYSVDKRGFNVVVYHKSLNRIIDSVVFDMHTEKFTCSRYDKWNYKKYLSNENKSITKLNNLDMLDVSKISLMIEDDLTEYLNKLSKIDNSIVYISVKDTCGSYVDDGIQTALYKLGLKNSFIKKWMCGYVAILDNQKIVLEKMTDTNKSIRLEEFIEDKFVVLLSEPFRTGNRAGIKIDGTDYCVNKRGINIVVYDKDLETVIDSVAFDLHSSKLTCSRKQLKLSPRIEMQKSIITSISAKKSNKYVPSRMWPDNNQKVKRLQINELFKNCHSKKKVTVFWWGDSIFFNVYKSLCEAFLEDENFSVKMVFYFKGHIKEKMELCESIGLTDYCEFKDYDVSLDKPDVFILPIIDSPWYDERLLRQIRENSKYFTAIYISDLNNYCSSTELLSKNIVDLYINFNIDNIIFDKLVYNEIKEAGKLKDQCVEIGNPKYDDIYYAFNKPKELPDDWKKLKSKKIVVWCTDHNWNSNLVSFDLYAQDIFTYFSENSDMALIFRPHRRYIEELMESAVWTKNDYIRFKHNFEKSENMIYDETPDFSLSYSIADAILVDSRTGMLISSLSTNKPIGILERYDIAAEPYYKNIITDLHDINSVDECISFLKMIQNGEDPKKDSRQKLFEKCISHFDGKNGLRIKEFIEKQLDEISLD